MAFKDKFSDVQVAQSSPGFTFFFQRGGSDDFSAFVAEFKKETRRQVDGKVRLNKNYQIFVIDRGRWVEMTIAQRPNDPLIAEFGNISMEKLCRELIGRVKQLEEQTDI